MKLTTLLSLTVSITLSAGSPTRADTPVDGYAPPKNAEEYAKRLNRLIDTGLKSKRLVVRTVQRLHRAASTVAKDDPRADYAFGLVLTHGLKLDLAAKQFQSATDKHEHTYLPAWGARLHTAISRNRGDTLDADARALTESVVKNSRWPSDAVRRKAVNLLGRLSGFLAFPDVDVMRPAAIKSLRDHLRANVPPALLPDFQAGEKQVTAEFLAVREKLRKAEPEAEAAQAQLLKKKRSELNDRKEELKDRTENLELSKTEWKAWLDQQMKSADAQLKSLEKDYQLLDRAARVTNSRLANAQFELGRERTRQSLLARPNRANNQIIFELEQQITRQNQQLFLLRTQASGVIGKARAAIIGRAAAIKKYTDATGQLVKESAMLKRWEQTVKKSDKSLTAKQDDDPASLRGLKRALTSPDTYFPLDIEKERDMLMQSLTGKS